MCQYDDDYPTCSRTYATLRLYTGSIPTADVTARLGLDPTSVQSTTASGRPLNGWFLTTDAGLESRDVRRHIDQLLDRVEPVRAELAALLREGVRGDVACYWRSARGHGGPTLSPSQMQRLAGLGLECWFDVCLTG